MAAVTRALLALLASLVVAISISPSAQANTSGLSDAGKEGLEQVSTCLRSNPNLVVLLVVDESGSLGGTDPEGRRGAVLADFVRSLAGLSGQQTPQGERRVEFAVNLFAYDSNPYLPWTTLDAGNSDQIAEQLESELPTRNSGGGTNYEAALQTASGTMAEGVNRVGTATPPCQMVVWFTDGLLEISSDPSENRDSAERLCAPSGPVDELRLNGIHLISVLLFDRQRLDGQPADIVEPFLEGIPLLQASAEGTGGKGKYATECGTVPIPSDAARGAFFEGNLDALSGQFTQAIALGSGGTSLPDVAAGTPTRFTIDPGFSAFWVSGKAPNGFTLTGPDGQPLTVNPGQSGGPVSTTSADVTWVASEFTVRVPLTDRDSGEWALARPGMTDAPAIYLFSNYSITIEPTDLVADELSTVRGQILDAEGSPADLSVFAERTLNVTQIVDGQEVPSVDFALDPQSGAFEGSFVPQAQTTRIEFSLALSLTSQSGIPLTPITYDFAQQVKFPGAYPQVDAEVIDLGALQNKGDVATAQVALVGSPDGPTQVCTTGSALITTPPSANLTVNTTPSGECIDIATSGAGSIEIQAVLGDAVIDGGQVRGEVQLLLKNAPTAELPDTRERAIAIPFTAQVLPVGPVLWVPFALTAIGILLPLAVLYLMNWLSARLRLAGMMMSRTPVLVPVAMDGPLRRQDETSIQLLNPDDFLFIAAPNEPRQWAPALETLRATAPLSPFGSVRAEVNAPDGYVVTSNESPTFSKTGHRAGIGMNPSTSAYLLVPESELIGNPETVMAELVTFLAPQNLQVEAAQQNSALTSFLGWSAALRSIAGQITDRTKVDPHPEETIGGEPDPWATTGDLTKPQHSSDDPPQSDTTNRFQL